MTVWAVGRGGFIGGILCEVNDNNVVIIIILQYNALLIAYQPFLTFKFKNIFGFPTRCGLGEL